jgi:hypothetical protein
MSVTKKHTHKPIIRILKKKHEFWVRPRTRSEQAKYWAGAVISCKEDPSLMGRKQRGGKWRVFISDHPLYLTLAQLFGDT